MNNTKKFSLPACLTVLVASVFFAGCTTTSPVSSSPVSTNVVVTSTSPEGQVFTYVQDALQVLFLAQQGYATQLVVEETKLVANQKSPTFAKDWADHQLRQLKFDAAVDHFQVAFKSAIKGWVAIKGITENPTLTQLTAFSTELSSSLTDLASLLGVKITK